MSKNPQPTQRPCDCTVTCGDDRRDIEAGIAIPCDAYRRQQQEALAAEARAARLADLIAQGSHKADIDLLDALEELHATKAQLAECTAAKDGAYLERNQVVAALAKCFPSGTAQTPIEGWSPEWFGCVYIDLPTGQASWHFLTSQAYLFSALPPYAGEWDGHSTAVKYERLAGLNDLERYDLTAGLLEAIDRVLDESPCDCPPKQRFDDGKHLSGCYLYDLNIERGNLLAALECAVGGEPSPQQTDGVPIAALNRIKQNLMHQRRFGVDDLGSWRRAATQAEGDIEEALSATRAIKGATR